LVHDSGSAGKAGGDQLVLVFIEQLAHGGQQRV